MSLRPETKCGLTQMISTSAFVVELSLLITVSQIHHRPVQPYYPHHT